MQLDIASNSEHGQIHAVFMVVPRFNLTTLITMIETLRIGNYLSSERLFSWEVTSFDELTLTASNGVQVRLSLGAISLPARGFWTGKKPRRIGR